LAIFKQSEEAVVEMDGAAILNDSPIGSSSPDLLYATISRVYGFLSGQYSSIMDNCLDNIS